MFRRTLAVLTISALLGFSLSGCGKRPSTDDLTKAFQKGVSVTVFGGTTMIKYDAKQAKCVAEVLRDSDISDETLAQLEKPTKSGKASAADEKALSAVAEKLQACDPDTPNALVVRPEEEAISAGFQSGLRGYAFGSKALAKAGPEKAKCLGGVLDKSKVSNLALTKMLDQDEDFTASTEDADAFKAISPDLNACLNPALGGATPSP